MSAAEDVDLFEALGVSQTATTEEVKRAYARRLREHPDLGDTAQHDFATLRKALVTLSDPQSRRRHITDLERQAQASHTEIVDDTVTVEDADSWAREEAFPQPEPAPSPPPAGPPPPPPYPSPPPHQAPPPPAGHWPPTPPGGPASSPPGIHIPDYRPGAAEGYRQVSWWRIALGRTLGQRIVGALWVLSIIGPFVPGLITGHAGGFGGTTLFVNALAVGGGVLRVRGRHGLFRLVCVGAVFVAVVFLIGSFELHVVLRALATGSVLLWLGLYIAAVRLRARDPELAS